MDGLTRSSREPNPQARASLALGLLGTLVIPAAILVSREVQRVSLVDAGASVPIAGALAIAAIVLGGRARRQVERTIGRIGEEGIARAGRALGLLALCLALMAALALGFYGLLTLLGRGH